MTDTRNAPSDRAVELEALKLFWATLRQDIAPELSSALAKDRAKRSDLALLRLVAGYQHLPAVRAEFAPRYERLLADARALCRSTGVAPAAPDGAPSGDGSPIFVGLPEYAGAIESHLAALAGARGTGAAEALERLLRAVAALEAECRAAYEARVATIAPKKGPAADRAVTVESMQRYLAAHPRAGTGVVVRSVHEIPGGRSKRTVLVALAEPGPLPPELVLRLDTGRGVGTSVLDEFPLLARIATLDLPVPEPLWLEGTGEPFGHPFIVFRRMPGAAAGDLIEGAFRKVPATARALARALGRVHGAGVRLIEDPARRGPAIADTRDLLRHYFDWWRSKKPFPSLVIEAAFAWLRSRIDGGLGESTVVHADTGFHNLLLDEAGNACLLDWEFAHFGDPAEDLAACRPAVERCMPWPEFLAEYRAHGGGEVSDFRLRYFDIWRPLRNAVVCGTTLHSMLQGEADDIDPVTIGLSTFQRLQADLAKTLERIVSAPA